MDPEEAGGGGGFVGALKSKFGPLPVWAWLAAITTLLLGYYLYEKHKAGTSAAASSSPDAGTADNSVPDTIIQNMIPPEQNTIVPPPSTPSSPVAAPPPVTSAPPGHVVPKPKTPAKPKTVTTNGKLTLYKIAKEYGISEQALVKDNPKLKHYYGSGDSIPAGTKVNV